MIIHNKARWILIWNFQLFTIITYHQMLKKTISIVIPMSLFLLCDRSEIFTLFEKEASFMIEVRENSSFYFIFFWLCWLLEALVMLIEKVSHVTVISTNQKINHNIPFYRLFKTYHLNSFKRYWKFSTSQIRHKF